MRQPRKQLSARIDTHEALCRIATKNKWSITVAIGEAVDHYEKNVLTKV